MSKVFYARQYSTGELATTDCHALIKIPDTKKIIKGVVIELNTIDAFTLSGLVMKIYSTDGNRAPLGLIATSTNSWTLTSMNTAAGITLANSRRDLYFDFDDVSLLGETWYAFSLQASTYVGDISAHLSWGLDLSDPLTTPEIAHGNDLVKVGLKIAIIGSV